MHCVGLRWGALSPGGCRARAAEGSSWPVAQFPAPLWGALQGRGPYVTPAGPYWPVVVAGLYGAGALIAPPERPPQPDFPPPSAQLEELRTDFGKLGAYLAEADLPPAAAGRLTELTDLLTALLDPGRPSELPTHDPEGVHTLSRTVRQDIPEAVDSYVRTRWWTRLTPGSDPPEHHLERQLTLLREEFFWGRGELRDQPQTPADDNGEGPPPSSRRGGRKEKDGPEPHTPLCAASPYNTAAGRDDHWSGHIPAGRGVFPGADVTRGAAPAPGTRPTAPSACGHRTC